MICILSKSAEYKISTQFFWTEQPSQNEVHFNQTFNTNNEKGTVSLQKKYKTVLIYFVKTQHNIFLKFYVFVSLKNFPKQINKSLQQIKD